MCTDDYHYSEKNHAFLKACFYQGTVMCERYWNSSLPGADSSFILGTAVFPHSEQHWDGVAWRMNEWMNECLVQACKMEFSLKYLKSKKEKDDPEKLKYQLDKM